MPRHWPGHAQSDGISFARRAPRGPGTQTIASLRRAIAEPSRVRAGAPPPRRIPPGPRPCRQRARRAAAERRSSAPGSPSRGSRDRKSFSAGTPVRSGRLRSAPRRRERGTVAKPRIGPVCDQVLGRRAKAEEVSRSSSRCAACGALDRRPRALEFGRAELAIVPIMPTAARLGGANHGGPARSPRR